VHHRGTPLVFYSKTTGRPTRVSPYVGERRDAYQVVRAWAYCLTAESFPPYLYNHLLPQLVGSYTRQVGIIPQGSQWLLQRHKKSPRETISGALLSEDMRKAVIISDPVQCPRMPRPVFPSSAARQYGCPMYTWDPILLIARHS